MFLNLALLFILLTFLSLPTMNGMLMLIFFGLAMAFAIAGYIFDDDEKKKSEVIER